MKESREVYTFVVKRKLTVEEELEVKKKINDDAYAVGLLDALGISKTFNVADIYPFYSSNMMLYPYYPGDSIAVEFFLK